MKLFSPQKEITSSLGLHPSTICIEIVLEVDKTYSHEFAHTISRARQYNKLKYTVITSHIKTYIKTKLKKTGYQNR